jgi:SAM-dependent methyltransferase
VCKAHLRSFNAHARCPVCWSAVRHRAVWHFLHTHTPLFDRQPQRLFHTAPEASFQARFASMKHLDYVTADLLRTDVQLQIDITAIPLDDATFDAVFSSHVLEHVPNDRQAIHEFFRILKPGGWAVIMVPITADQTFEDPTITDPKERERLFGQDDHVRRYGPDFADRLTEAGFQVERYSALAIVGAHAQEWGIFHDEPIFLCRKPTA